MASEFALHHGSGHALLMNLTRGDQIETLKFQKRVTNTVSTVRVVSTVAMHAC